MCDRRLDEALNIMKATAAKKANKSTDAIYGQYVTSKLETYSPRCKSIVQHLINNILFDADMGKYEEPPSLQSLHNQTVLGNVPALYPSTHALQPFNSLPSTSRQFPNYPTNHTATVSSDTFSSTSPPLHSPTPYPSPYPSQPQSPAIQLSCNPSHTQSQTFSRAASSSSYTQESEEITNGNRPTEDTPDDITTYINAFQPSL